VLGVQWIASSAITVHAVWHDYKALISHFKAASNDPNRDSREKATYKALKWSQLNSFLLNMGLLLDALMEAEDLSLELQKCSISLIIAHKLLEIKY
jgi:hypothetical protein